MNNYDCEHGRYAGAGCGECEAEHKARKEAHARREASRAVAYYAVCTWGRVKMDDAAYESDAQRKAVAQWGDSVLRVTKTVTETVWEKPST